MDLELNAGNVLLIILIILLCVVVYQFYFIKKCESFETDTPTLFIFVSKTCPHCITYNEKTHPILEKALADTNIKLKKVFADEDPDKLFDKFDVKYVPAFWCVKGNKKEQVQQIYPEFLKEKFNSM